MLILVRYVTEHRAPSREPRARRHRKFVKKEKEDRDEKEAGSDAPAPEPTAEPDVERTASIVCTPPQSLQTPYDRGESQGESEGEQDSQ